MKKMVLASGMLLILFTSYSQQFGLKGGLNIANIGGDSQGVSSKTSFHVGLFMLTPISSNVKIMPELVYSSQGATASSGSGKINYDYLNIPVMFNIYPSQKFFFQVGPQLGILTSAEITSGTSSVSVKSQLKDTDFAIAAGLGVDLPKVLLNARYNFGITSTSKVSSGSFPNNVIQISLGIKF